MANPLTASLSSSRTRRNTALPGDTVSFTFSTPPSSVTAVEINIQQAQFQQGQLLIPGSVLATFEGDIVNGKYVPRKATGRRLPPRTHMPLTLSDGTNNLKVGLVDNGDAELRSELQITVGGTVAGKREFFQGNAALFVEYPLVMIVAAPPAPAATRDPSLRVVPSWADQWGKKTPGLRTIVSVTPSSRPAGPPLAATEYDSLITAFTTAVNAAPGGIVALATGHGDGGQGSTLGIPWCNLMPENIAKIIHPDGSETFPHRLFINLNELIDGVGARTGTVVRTPGADTVVKLRALDRIADVLKTARLPIRKVLLHTCNVGNSQNFTQLLADRLQVPVQSHLDFISYTGVAGSGTILAHYDSETPQTPQGLTEWPLSKVSKESIPGTPPRRF